MAKNNGKSKQDSLSDMMRAITLYEWTKGNTEACSLFTSLERVQLERFNDAFKRRTDEDAIKVTPRGRIDTFSYVGVIQIGRKRIEILPKIHDPKKQANGSDDAERLKSHARKNLLQMLAFSGVGDIQEGGTTEYAKTNADLFEFLVKIFLNDLEQALAAHVHREYVEHDSPLNLIRGRIDLKREIAKTLAQQSKIFCIYDELSMDNHLNKVIKATLNRISRLSASEENRQRCRMYSQLLDDVEDITVKPEIFARIRFNRLNHPYVRIINFCKLVWSDLSYISNDGGEPFSAILFDMNLVFEAYVSKILRRDLIGYDVKLQEPMSLASELDGQKRTKKTVYPDICIKKQNKRLLIVDAKYKLNLEDGYISAPDFYQMIAYSVAAETDTVVLLYPMSSLQSEAREKEYTVQLDKTESGAKEGRRVDIIAMSISIFDDKQDGKLIRSLNTESNRAVFEKIRSYL